MTDAWRSLREALDRPVFGGAAAVPEGSVALLFGELAVMAGAGLSIERALAVAERLPDRRAARLAGRLLAQVRRGTDFSGALLAEGPPLSGLPAAMVRAGEASGRLADSLAALAEQLERGRALRRSLRQALAYPLVVCLVAAVAMAVVFAVLVPQVRGMLAGLNAAPPDSARLLFALTDGLPLLAALGLGTVLAGFGLWALARRDDRWRLRRDRWLLAVPGLGPLLRRVAAARLLRALGSLLGGGVALASALPLAAGAVGNAAIAGAVLAAAERVRGGAALSPGLMPHLPAPTGDLLAVGEETAQLGAMALRAAEIAERDAQRALQAALGLLGPALVVLLGAVVGALFLSLLAALGSAADALL
ncbi:MAG TPA: type II secretion system F family protein [Alphaproteobacteria bacterium]|nr:type II secretion system F family protein [Alphaproteobacteria bacterium]